MSGQFLNSKGQAFELIDVVVPALPAGLGEKERGKLATAYILNARMRHIKSQCHTQEDLEVARRFGNRYLGRNWGEGKYRGLSDTITKSGKVVKDLGGDPSIVQLPPPANPAPPANPPPQATSVPPADIVGPAPAPQVRLSVLTGRPLLGPPSKRPRPSKPAPAPPLQPQHPPNPFDPNNQPASSYAAADEAYMWSNPEVPAQLQPSGASIPRAPNGAPDGYYEATQLPPTLHQNSSFHQPDANNNPYAIASDGYMGPGEQPSFGATAPGIDHRDGYGFANAPGGGQWGEHLPQDPFYWDSSTQQYELRQPEDNSEHQQFTYPPPPE